MAHVLIYSSARKLLAAGRTGFGTVARSRKISTLAVGAIERLSQFDRKRGSDSNRVILAHRRINVGNTAIHLLSSICDAGADYTGRTNHLAHHLLVDASEARRLAGQGITPADILQNYAWLKSWDGAPRYFEDSEDVDLLALNIRRQAGAREHWQRLTGNGIHARLIASKQAPKSAVLVLPDNEPPLPLMAEALTELDSHSWDVTFTTALEPSDSVGDFAWMITSASAFSAVQDRCSSRVILRADDPVQLSVPEERPEARPTVTSKQAVQSAQGGVTIAKGERDTSPTHSSQTRDLIQSASGSLDRSYRSSSSTTGAAQRKPRRQQPQKQGVPVLAIVGASVLLVLAVVVLVMVWIKGNNGNVATGGGSDSPKDGVALTEQLSGDQKRLRDSLLDKWPREDATKIAKNTDDEDCKKLGLYFDELKKLCDKSTSWGDLPALKQLKEPPMISEGAHHYLVGLFRSSSNKKVIEDLILLAEATPNDPLTPEQWRAFAGIAKSYGGKKPFNGDKMETPFPKMAKELLKRHLGENFNAVDDSERLGKILKLEIWKEPKYNKIPSAVYLSATRNADSFSMWGELMLGYKELKSKLGQGSKVQKGMAPYLNFYDKYKKCHVDDKISEAKLNRLEDLLKDLKDNPEGLPNKLHEHLEAERKQCENLLADKKKKQSDQEDNQAPSTRYFVFHTTDISDSGISTRLIEKFVKALQDKEKTDKNRGWEFMVDGERAYYGGEEIRTRGGTLARLSVVGEGSQWSLINGKLDFQELKLINEPETDYILIYGSRPSQNDKKAVWGEDHKFTLHEQGRWLVLKGELAESLKAVTVKSDRELKFRVNDDVKLFKKLNNGLWAIKNFFPEKPKPIGDFKEVKPGNNKHGKSIEELRDKIGNLCKEYEELRPKKTGNETDKEKIQTEIDGKINKLDKVIRSLFGDDETKLEPYVDDFFKQSTISKSKYSSFTHENNHPKLIKFAKYILKQSDRTPFEGEYLIGLKNSKILAQSFKTIEVRSPGVADNQILLFKGKAGEFVPEKPKK
jgi:hypothetical protein